MFPKFGQALQNLLNKGKKVANSYVENVAKPMAVGVPQVRQAVKPLVQSGVLGFNTSPGLVGVDTNRGIKDWTVQPKHIGIKPFDYTSDRITNYINNTYLSSAKDIPQATKQIFTPGKTNVLGANIPNPVVGTGRLALDVLGAVPDKTDLYVAGANYLKGRSRAKLEGLKGWDATNRALEAVTYEKPVGLGSALTMDPTGEAIGNLAELPLMMGTVSRMRKGTNIGFDKSVVDKFRNQVLKDPIARSEIQQFATLVEYGKDRSNMGKLGLTIDYIAKDLFGENATGLTNKQLKNMFDLLYQQAERPQKFKLNKINLGFTTQNVREGLDAQAGLSTKGVEETLKSGWKKFQHNSSDAFSITKDYSKKNMKLTPEEDKLVNEFFNYANRPENLAKYEAGANDTQIMENFIKDRVADIPTITLYHASPKMPTKGNWKEGTYLATSPDSAMYYATSHHRGDVRVVPVEVPKDLVAKEGQYYRLKGEYPVSVQPSKSQLDLAREANITQQPLSTKGVESMQSAGEVIAQSKKLQGLKSSSSVPNIQPELSQVPQTKGTQSKQGPQTYDSIIEDAKKEIGEAPKEKPQSLRQSFDNFYTQWVDRFHPVVKASELAESKLNGAVLRPENNPKYLVRRLTGATGIADARVRRELDPIIKEAEGLKIDKGDLDVYLKARRDAGFDSAGRSIKGSDPVLARERISALEAKYGGSIKSVADKLYEYQNKGFQEMVDAGFISPEAGATIRSQNPDYVPFDRVMDELDNYLGLPTRKLMQGSQPIKKIKGSERQIYSPLESIMTNTFKQRAAIEKNRVAKAITGLQQVAPELGFKKVAKSGDDTITVWNNGQKEYWSVGKDIAETAKGLNEENTNALLKLFTGPASLLRQGATGRNPEFMIPNIIRDQLDAGISSKYGYVPFVDYLSGLKSIITDDAIFKKWEASGAKIDLGSMSGSRSVPEATKKGGLFKGLGDLLDWMGKYSEQPTRVGLFKKAYQKTGNELLAGMESRDATVDFARMGSKMKVANSIIPFLNVGVQGFDKLIRSIKNQPMKVALNATVYGVLPTVTTTLYNLTQYPDEYAEIPQFEKDSNFVIVKGRNENGTVDYVSIPKGNILPVISNPVQSFLEFSKGQSQQTFGEFATQFLSSALPVVGDGQSLQEVAIKTIGSNLPQLVKPVAENLLNKSFYKYDTKKEQSKEIVPSYLQNKPAYQQTYKFTPELYQKIGQVFDASPLKVQNLLEGYLAGYVKIPSNIIDTIKAMSDGKEVEQNKIPLMRRFLKETYPTSETKKKEAPEAKKTTVIERLSGDASAAERPPNIVKYTKNGKDREVDLNYTPYEPDFKSTSEIDKEAVSRYKSEISSQINKVYDAYEYGDLTKEQATQEIDRLKTFYDKSKKPKKTGGVSKTKVNKIFNEIKKFNKPMTFKLRSTKTARRRSVNVSLKTKKLQEFQYKGKPFSLKKNPSKSVYL